jgi:hypothetical protein
LPQKIDVFPRNLLKRPADERYKYFAEYTVSHTVLANAFSTLRATILRPCGKQLILVIGPTRAGKTFLLEWIKDELEDLWANEQDPDPGRIPVVGLEIPSRDRASPTASDIYVRILEALEEPLLDKKTLYGDVAVYRNTGGKIVVEAKNIARLRRALEKALEHRKPCVLLDEAQHLLDMGGLTIEDIMDWIKSLANMTRCLIVLFGTYEMLDFVDLNDQLMCRSKIIHLCRYTKQSEHLNVFNSTLFSFQKNLPLEEEPNLIEYSEYLHERTAGCVGNLYNWLSAAYALSLNEGGKALTLDHLRATVPLTAVQASKLEANILDDENRFRNDIGETIESKAHKNRNSKKPSKLTIKPGKDVRKSNHRRRVGERNPSRDPTGGREKAA